jgi:hypothetical protein
VLKLGIATGADNQSWEYLASKQIEEFSLATTLQDEASRRTICFHSVTMDNSFVYLFLVNKSSEVIGQFLDSDFALL